MINTHHLRDTGLIFETHLEHFDRDVIEASHTLPILVDFWAKGPRYQRVMLWVVLGLLVVTMAGFLPRHLMHVFGGE